MDDIVKKHLIREEGFHQIPYVDSKGIPTVGIGHNIAIKQSKEIVWALYENDEKKTIEYLDFYLGWWRGLDESRQKALFVMCFQMGIDSLRGFKKMLKALEAGNYRESYKEALDSKWFREDSPGRAKRVAKIFLSGKFK